ncbi:hypothetical protein ColTof4_14321 [Colletotrichum tofieldiae]|nr:hypothetical protein ColTof3_14730 [Colletotrichum tofieldiae]GKT81898.1 hypothetical protein ColTof4_14321 [Colletotrichum tofieldiae]
MPTAPSVPIGLSLPSEGVIQDHINNYPFRSFPTTTAIGAWAGAALPAGPSLGAAALQHHAATHARVLGDTLRAQGKGATGRHLVRLQHLERLREAWPAAG